MNHNETNGNQHFDLVKTEQNWQQNQGNLLRDIDNFLGVALKAVKVSFFIQCTKMQLITLKNIQTCFSPFLWFFSLKS